MRGNALTRAIRLPNPSRGKEAVWSLPSIISHVTPLFSIGFQPLADSRVQNTRKSSFSRALDHARLEFGAAQPVIRDSHLTEM